eukprot:scaffold128722_cov33-Tisochrysis_lutea.AAC.1
MVYPVNPRMDRCRHPCVPHVWAQAHCVVCVSESAALNSRLPYFPVRVMVWCLSRAFGVFLAIFHAVIVTSDHGRGRV